MVPAGITLRPTRLPTDRGELAVLEFVPEQGDANNWALLVPPFGEELNRCRRMLALGGKRLAASGYRVLLVDLYGTGESDGDFGDARLQLWQQDLVAAAEWIALQGGRLKLLLGLRFGALLAVSMMARWPKLDHMMFWQPVLRGRDVIQDQLRLRSTASRMASDGPVETTAQLRECLASGDGLEVAGYQLASELTAAVEQLELNVLPADAADQVTWLQVVANLDSPPPLPVTRAVEAFQASGVAVQLEAVTGPRFWSTVEISEAPGLIERTAELAR